MSSRITIHQVSQTAKLSRLILTDEQTAAFTSQIESILEYVGKLNELDTDGVEPLDHPLTLSNVLREDDPQPSISQELAVRESPERHGSFFRTPKVLGNDSGA